MKKINKTPIMVSEINVSYKPSFYPVEKIKNSNDALLVIRKVYEDTNCQIQLREYFFLILLNKANRVTSYYLLSVGGISGTIADLRIAFAVALKCVASAMILVHNHPSGNINPSDTDIQLTKRFKEAGTLLEIPILDHIILTNDSHFSFSDNGLL